MNLADTTVSPETKKDFKHIKVARSFRMPTRFGWFEQRDGKYYVAEYATYEAYCAADDSARTADASRINKYDLCRLSGSVILQYPKRVVAILNPQSVPRD